MTYSPPVNEIKSMSDMFCLDNPQTAFLLKRMKQADARLHEQATRTAYYALLIAQYLNMDDNEQEVLYRTALLMDIGRLRLGDRELQGEDEEAERRVRLHPTYSWGLLEPLIVRGLVDGEAVLQHHENLDGTGFPFEKTWKDITLNARILRVADTFASITGYDRRLGRTVRIEEALEELNRWADVMYDEDLVNLMLHIYGPGLKKDKHTPLRKVSHKR
ncbi:hypothetical protein J31TS4_43300 [Paenibacillus sp. J31TS4]|uniref:HD-GYP domain-containing protein n=1 Tax=Paenibacillus sp. J31TS4 TaxID=2807195 RepID=UPI001B158AF4|nr:HD domain-containing phosphohydrolase [Paenibacillus sp. J31TS4]GIP41050.1 hypothetical protein J31TS4_43300 [Paenibacillus sp. J31TS4]